MATVQVQSPVRHEDFCVSPEPRMERYTAFRDDDRSNRSVPAFTVDRCLECGAARYTPR